MPEEVKQTAEDAQVGVVRKFSIKLEELHQEDY
jgi:hypothetical protein